MTSSRIRRAAAALALAAVLGLGAPVHAAGWPTWTATPGWLDNALERIARLWTGGGPALGKEPGRIKSDQGIGIDPNGGSSTPQPPPPATNSESDQGNGIDPNG